MSSYKAFLLLIISTLQISVSNGQAVKKKVLFVIVDGIPADVIEKVKTPHLDAIAKVGGYARAHVGGQKGTYSQTPTISAVGYNSLLTGTWVNKHNVWDNNIKAPNYNYWTIFRFFENQYPQKKTAIFSTWLDNRTKLVGEGLLATKPLRIDYKLDGLEKDTVQFPHDNDSQYIHKIDEKVTDTAAVYLTKQSPDLTWVYLEYTDDMGHKYGDSDRLYDAVKIMDNQMGRLWKAVQYRQQTYGEDWQVFITTDHGRTADTGKNHGGQSDRERNTWIVTNAKELNKYFQKSVPGIVDIMPTMAKHLNIKLPKEKFFEIDGIPLTGKLSVIQPIIKKEGKTITASWTPVETEGTVKVWLSTTNHFEEGKPDSYTLMTEVPISSSKAVIDVSKLPTGFYKVVLEGRYNTVNRWIVE